MKGGLLRREHVDISRPKIIRVYLLGIVAAVGAINEADVQNTLATCTTTFVFAGLA